MIALAPVGLSTPRVFAECDRLRGQTRVPDPEISDALMAALRGGDPVALGKALSNDLQPAAFSLRPQLRALLELGRRKRALGAAVSGSGPTCAFLVEGRDAGRELAAVLLRDADVLGTRVATGPVHGARIIDSRLDEADFSTDPTDTSTTDED